MTEKQIMELQNDLMIGTTLLSAAIGEDKLQELADAIEERYLSNMKNDINSSAEYLNDFAEKLEVYEACSIFKSVVKKLNK